VVQQFFPSTSPSSSNARSPGRAYSAQNSVDADADDTNDVSEPEYRALIAAALGDDYLDAEDGQPDK
jgi:hypothetical protein